MKIISHSLEETYDLARSIAERFKNNGGIIALTGDLGSGKTAFTQGFAQALGIKDKIISPTYVLMRQHFLPEKGRTLYHLDLYRLDKVDVNELGLADIFNQKEDIVLIEWADKMQNDLPRKSYMVKIKNMGGDQREIEVLEPAIR